MLKSLSLAEMAMGTSLCSKQTSALKLALIHNIRPQKGHLSAEGHGSSPGHTDGVLAEASEVSDRAMAGYRRVHFLSQGVKQGSNDPRMFAQGGSFWTACLSSKLTKTLNLLLQERSTEGFQPDLVTGENPLNMAQRARFKPVHSLLDSIRLASGCKHLMKVPPEPPEPSKTNQQNQRCQSRALCTCQVGMQCLMDFGHVTGEKSCTKE
ncbi:hypothetical protein Baya_14417 [Bagarius yarrelli]|uniref:Uncharacterized protein n=1 Tax=Bagarius yarrelli TaxID=175774 RepID=A0A556V8K0_BAGYA|nr:hypothetical protein Baya_14417 [Bagarius yarrelli]